MDGRLQALIAFYVGLGGEVLLFVMTEFFHRPVENAFVTMFAGLVAIGIANGATSKDKTQPPPIELDDKKP